jgi:hypothetical protein
MVTAAMKIKAARAAKAPVAKARTQGVGLMMRDRSTPKSGVGDGVGRAMTGVGLGAPTITGVPIMMGVGVRTGDGEIAEVGVTVGVGVVFVSRRMVTVASS